MFTKKPISGLKQRLYFLSGWKRASLSSSLDSKKLPSCLVENKLVPSLTKNTKYGLRAMGVRRGGQGGALDPPPLAGPK